MSYTNLSNNPEYLWNQVSPMLDKYATFRWDNEDMTLYHAFIINEKKGSLKFYNGPSFSNNYTQSQFESASSKFTGVTFKTQQISFTIAVYAITEELYRKLIYKLHPYTISNLSFGFEPNWRYVCKLSNISDSTRYIIGHYIDNSGQTKELYYTELKLTFDIIGDAVAQSTQELSYIEDPIRTFNFNKESSELDTPFIFIFKINLSDVTETMPFVALEIQENKTSMEQDNKTSIQLFKIIFQNLTPNHDYTFEYNSQTGDLCLVNGDKRKIITMLTTFQSGNRITSFLETRPYLLTGTFNGGDFSNMTLKLSASDNLQVITDWKEGCGINCYARRNLI